jgi:hypothetical protein
MSESIGEVNQRISIKRFCNQERRCWWTFAHNGAGRPHGGTVVKAVAEQYRWVPC